MLPVNEGNAECRKCKHFDMSHGCIATHPLFVKNGLPPCGRDIVMTQEDFKKLKKGKKKKLWGMMHF